MKNKVLNTVTTMLSIFFIALFLILLWNPLAIIVNDIELGLLMFVNENFWTFISIIFGMFFVITFFVRFVIIGRFGGKN